jgi:phenylalanine-4-hydroxylase
LEWDFKPGTIVELNTKTDNILHNLWQNEPYFVFRAQDILSSFAIEAYLTLLEKFNPHSPQVEAVTEELNRIRAWQQANPDKVKLPD